MGTNNTIFEFADQFSIESPFGNWAPPSKDWYKSNINYAQLIAYLKSAREKRETEIFDFSKYKGTRPESRRTDNGMQYSLTIGTDIPFIYKTHGEVTKELNLKAYLNVKRERVDFSVLPSFEILFSSETEKIQYQLKFKYKNFTGQDELDKFAIILYSEYYSDFELLMKYLDLKITDTGKNILRPLFKTAFANSTNNVNKLDWVYEHAPAFILQELPDDKLFADLTLLSKADVDKSGTNENISILNILAAIKDKKIFYEHINSDPKIVRTLFEKFNREYIPDLIVSFTKIGVNIWTAKDYELASQTFYINGIVEADLDNDRNTDLTYAGTCTYLEKEKKYEVGYNIHLFEKGSFVASESRHNVLGKVLPFAPLSMSTEDVNLFIPAFVAEYFTNEKIDEQRRLAINNALALVLPELSAIKLKRLAEIANAVKVKILKSIDELVVFLNNIQEGFRAIDLEKVGIKALFRGTTRNLKGDLFSGSANSIANGLPTSTDPIKATIFGIESATKSGAEGVLQITAPENLKDITLLMPSRRVDIELEVVLKTSAENLSKMVTKEIPIEKVRNLIDEIYGIKLPAKIYDFNESRQLLETIHALSLEESYEFYKKLITLK